MAESVEGAPLLREYGPKAHRGFESLSLRHLHLNKSRLALTPGRDGKDNARPQLSSKAPVAQLDRVPGYEPGGREFESLRARQPFKINDLGVNSSFAAVLPHHFQFRYIIIKQQVIFSYDHLARNLVVRQAYLTDQNIIKALE
jgi:hypothetical protein